MHDNWQLDIHEDHTFDLTFENQDIFLEKCLPEIGTRDQTIRPDASWQFERKDSVLIYQLPGSWRISLILETRQGDLHITSMLENIGKKEVPIEYFRPLTATRLCSTSPFDRLLGNGQGMCEFSSLLTAPTKQTSFTVAGFTEANGSRALVAGFTNPRDAFYSFDCKLTDGGGDSLSACVHREGIALGPGRPLQVSDLVLIAGGSLNDGMKKYARLTAQNLGSRLNDTATGWCSWYYYYETVTQQAVWDNMDAINACGLGEQVRVIQIDDGWNRDTPKSPRGWGDWQPGKLFEYDMKAVADGIKSKGFVPGLWLAPFSVDAHSTLCKEHSDWLVQGENGPADFFGAFALDLSRPEVLEFVRETFDRVFNQWGFEYVKIDFLLHAVLPGKRKFHDKTTASLLRDGLKVIRDVAGDRFILGCGCPMTPAVGIVDAMRIGNDVSSRWFAPVNLEAWPAGNLNIKAAAIHTVWRNWMHRTWWQNDPDCIVVRDYGSNAEIENCRHHFPDLVNNPPFGLTDNEARFWLELIRQTGTMAILSENMTELKGDRKALLEQAFPPKQSALDWVDYYADPELAILKSPDGDMLAIFNISDQQVNLTLPAEKLSAGTDSKWTETRTGIQVSSDKQNNLQFPAVGPRSCSIWKRTT